MGLHHHHYTFTTWGREGFVLSRHIRFLWAIFRGQTHEKRLSSHHHNTK